MNWSEKQKMLQMPFPAEEIEWRVGSTNSDKTKGLALAYVTNRAIQNRLDDVFGCDGWKNEFAVWHGSAQLCGISVYDDNKKEWITKWDGAEQTDFEPIKGGLSDAMKRAAYQWGMGRYLYDMPSQWVEIEQRGKSYVIKKAPTIPKNMLPDNTPPCNIKDDWDDDFKALIDSVNSAIDKEMLIAVCNKFNQSTHKSDAAKRKAFTEAKDAKKTELGL